MKYSLRSHEAKRANFYRGEATLHSRRLLHKRSVFMRKARFIEKSTSEEVLFSGAPSGTRTRDPLIKSQLLYQLS